MSILNLNSRSYGNEPCQLERVGAQEAVLKPRLAPHDGSGICEQQLETGAKIFVPSIGGRLGVADEMGCARLFHTYLRRLSETAIAADLEPIELLAWHIRRVWVERKTVYLCGNGGSASNAVHIANDLLAALGKGERPGIRAHALSANPAVLTCLGNDIGYDRIYAQQIHSCGEPGDVLIVLSGSGNSKNVVEAIKTAKAKGLVTAALSGYTGGACRNMADISIHFPLDDMQIAEDLQLVVGHMIMQWLCANGPSCEDFSG